MNKIILMFCLAGCLLGCTVNNTTTGQQVQPKPMYKVTLWAGEKPVKTWLSDNYYFWSERTIIRIYDHKTGKEVDLLGTVSIEEQ